MAIENSLLITERFSINNLSSLLSTRLSVADKLISISNLNRLDIVLINLNLDLYLWLISNNNSLLVKLFNLTLYFIRRNLSTFIVRNVK